MLETEVLKVIENFMNLTATVAEMQNKEIFELRQKIERLEAERPDLTNQNWRKVPVLFGRV
jgi:uncharacterized protein (UPF0335 family)